MMRPHGLLSLACTLLVFPAWAGDWPQYKRDAARSGDAPEEALSLPLRRTTAVRFPAPIYASPAVVAGKVYVQDARGNLACIDSAANRVLWVTNLGGVANQSSPAVANGKVYVGSSAGHLAIVDAASGKVLTNVPGEGGVIAAPAVANGAVYFSTLAGQLIKLDGDGKVRWRFSGGPSCHLEFAVRGREILFFGLAVDDKEKPRREASAILYRLEDEGGRVSVLSKSYTMDYPTGGPTFGPGQQCVYQSWNAERGGFIVHRWDQDPKGSYQLSLGDLVDSRITPSVRGKHYFLGDRTGLICAAADAKASIVWRSGGWPYYGPNGFHSSPALGKDTLAAGCDDGRVYFFPLAHTGQDRNKIQKPVWIYETEGADRVNGAVSSSPAIADGKVFFGGEDGILYGLGRGKEAATVSLPEAMLPKAGERPGSRLRGHEWLTAGGDMGFSGVSPDTQLRPPLRIEWRTRVWGSFKGCPVVADGRVFAASRSGTLTALDAETGEILWRGRHPYTDSWATPTYAAGKLLVFRGNSAAPKGKEGGGIWCHDAQNGKLLWRKSRPVPTGQYDFSASLVVHDRTVLACWHAGKDVLEAAAYRLADGETVWTRRYPQVLPAAGTGQVHVSQGCLGDGAWYCSISRTGRNGKVAKEQGQGGATLAIDPKDGVRLWLTDRFFVSKESRVSCRKETVVVVDGWESTAHALNHRTGQHLWSAKIVSTQMNPLTDLFLASRGAKGVSGSGFCGYHCYVNGVFYGTRGYSQTELVARAVDERGGVKTVWTYPTIARSCPAPAPAYGRLYYAPNDEGVIYCFQNAEKGE